MSERVIAIGDIHGCARALETLINEIKPTASDTLVPLGDFVDRGPDSKAVIERLIELQEVCRVRPILGNHEEMMIEVLLGRMAPESWLPHGAVDTLDSYGFAGDMNCVPQGHLDFIISCLNFFECSTHFFVHASYIPELPLTDQPEDILRWTSLSRIIPPPHESGKIAVVGHTANREGEVLDFEHLICLDTYCYGGGWLSALDVTSGTIWQANQAGQLRQ